jgi:uncharacterized protein
LRTQPAQEVSVAWQGGEPTLMGLDFFKRSIELVKRYQKPDQQISYTLQTNGTRLGDEWCAFFKEHGFLVGLSIDGPAKLHDAFRVDKGGMGSHAQAIAAWELLQKHKVETNILCTVNAANGSHPLEVYRFFKYKLKAGFIQFIPIVEREGSLVSRRSVKPEQFGRFLNEVFDEWVQQDVGRVFVQTFEAALASWYGLQASVCIFQETCGQALVLEHNGDLYVCDHFVEPGYRLGNILETPMWELVNTPLQHQFGLDKRKGLPAYCRVCEVRFACNGECPRNRFGRTPDGEAGLNYLCEGYQMFFRHVDKPMRRMAELLRQGRPAEGVMDTGIR